MNKKIIISVICLVLFYLFICPVSAGLFSMTKPQSQENSNSTGGSIQNMEQAGEEIPVFDTVDKMIIKRRDEAWKLVAEGRSLIEKGKRRNDKQLITKGQIKKEIGEKQLKALKEQAESKKEEDKSYGW